MTFTNSSESVSQPGLAVNVAGTHPDHRSGQPLALIVGSKGIGLATAQALVRRGWRVRVLARSSAVPADARDIEWAPGDAMEESSVCEAARGTTIIVHAANPAGYRGWSRLVLPMLANVIAAAKKNQARIVLPGTLYNYDPTVGPDLTEDAPQNPQMRKGKIRVAMEQRLNQAASDGVRSLIIRFGDFFGPQPGNSWFSQALIRPGRPAGQILYPGKDGVGHAWAYLPDAGEVLALLAERERELPVFENFHFEGHWDPDGRALTSQIRNSLQDPQLPVRRFPWSVIGLAAPFNETFRELVEVRSLWTKPLRLINTKLLSFLGREPRTPLAVAVSETLIGLGVTRRAVRPNI